MGSGASSSTKKSSDIVQELVPTSKMNGNEKSSSKHACSACAQANSLLYKEQENLKDIEVALRNLKEENRILKIRVNELEAENSRISEDLVVLESQLESTNGTNFSTDENYNKLAESKNKIIQNMEAELSLKTKEINDLKSKHETTVNKLKHKIESLKKENALKMSKFNDEIKRHETENNLLNDTVKIFSENNDTSSSTKLVVELSNHINEKDNTILELNNEIREKDDHIGLLEKKLHKYKVKLKKSTSTTITSKSKIFSNSRNFSAPSPRLANNQAINKNNRFSIKEFAFEAEIVSDSEHAQHANDTEILDSSISSIDD